MAKITEKGVVFAPEEEVLIDRMRCYNGEFGHHDWAKCMAALNLKGAPVLFPAALTGLFQLLAGQQAFRVRQTKFKLDPEEVVNCSRFMEDFMGELFFRWVNEANPDLYLLSLKAISNEL